MVRVVRLERTVSWSQTRRDTNFAIPGYSFFCHYTTARAKIKDFSVCGHSCGQSRFYATFSNQGKSRKHRRHKALRRFTLPRPGYRHGAPKPGAIPTSLHPDIRFSLSYHVSPQKATGHVATWHVKKTGGFLERNCLLIRRNGQMHSIRPSNYEAEKTERLRNRRGGTGT